ncbi:hypothetical protein BG004_000053 [Podila humilis]|nr:hypothetical protein BG004_000053 [Podila humilis]
MASEHSHSVLVRYVSITPIHNLDLTDDHNCNQNNNNNNNNSGNDNHDIPTTNIQEPFLSRAHCHVEYPESGTATTSMLPPSRPSFAKLTLARALSEKQSMSDVSIHSGIDLPSSQSSSAASTPPGTPSSSQLSFSIDSCPENQSTERPEQLDQEYQYLDIDSEHEEDADGSHFSTPIAPVSVRLDDINISNRQLRGETEQPRQVNFEDIHDTVSNDDSIRIASSVAIVEGHEDDTSGSNRSKKTTFPSARKLRASLRRKLSKLVVSEQDQPVYILYPKAEQLDHSPASPQTPDSLTVPTIPTIALDTATPPPAFPYNGRLEYSSRYGSEIMTVDPAIGRNLDLDAEGARQRERLHRKAVLRSKSMSNGKSRRLPNYTPPMTEGRDTEPVEVARIRRIYSTRGRIHHHPRTRRSSSTPRPHPQQQPLQTRKDTSESAEWVDQHQRHQLSDNITTFHSEDATAKTPSSPKSLSAKNSRPALSRQSSTARKISTRDPNRSPRHQLVRNKSRFGTHYELYRQMSSTRQSTGQATTTTMTKKTIAMTGALTSEAMAHHNAEQLQQQQPLLPTISTSVALDESTTDQQQGPQQHTKETETNIRQITLSFQDPIGSRRLSRSLGHDIDTLSKTAGLRRGSRDQSRNRWGPAVGGRRRSSVAQLAPPSLSGFVNRRLSIMSFESTKSSIAHSVYSEFSTDWQRPEFYEKSKSPRYPASLQTKIKTKVVATETVMEEDEDEDAKMKDGDEEARDKKKEKKEVLDVNDLSTMVAQGIDPNERHQDPEAFYRYQFDYYLNHGVFRPELVDLVVESQLNSALISENDDDASLSLSLYTRSEDGKDEDERSSMESPKSLRGGGILGSLRRATSRKFTAMARPLKPVLSLKRKKSRAEVTADVSSTLVSDDGAGAGPLRLMAGEKIDTIVNELSPNGDGGIDERWMDRVPEDERRPGRFDIDWLDAMPL